MPHVRGPTSAFRGSVPDGPGFWYPPTVLLARDGAERHWREEIFGPVVSVLPFAAEEDAVRLANDLRSVRRDQREGRLNILTLRTRAGTHVTQVYVRRQVQQYVLGHLTALVDTLDVNLRSSVRALANCLRVSVALYRVGDLR